MNDTPLSDCIFDACEEIDAAMFSGDEFIDAERRKHLRELMARWERGLKEWDETDAETCVCGQPHHTCLCSHDDDDE